MLSAAGKFLMFRIWFNIFDMIQNCQCFKVWGTEYIFIRLAVFVQKQIQNFPNCKHLEVQVPRVSEQEDQYVVESHKTQKFRSG